MSAPHETAFTGESALAADAVAQFRDSGLDSWRGVELRHLLAFQAVAAERSFCRAAAVLGYTQSAVSQQIAVLERLIGMRLLLRGRGRGGVRLTAPGEVLLMRTAELLALALQARAELGSSVKPAATRLRHRP